MVCPKALMSFRDVMCGKLFCENGNDDPNYGRLVQFNKCKATFYSDRDYDYGQVDTGTKCGEEKVTMWISIKFDLQRGYMYMCTFNLPLVTVF